MATSSLQELLPFAGANSQQSLRRLQAHDREREEMLKVGVALIRKAGERGGLGGRGRRGGDGGLGFNTCGGLCYAGSLRPVGRR